MQIQVWYLEILLCHRRGGGIAAHLDVQLADVLTEINIE